MTKPVQVFGQAQRLNTLVKPFGAIIMSKANCLLLSEINESLSTPTTIKFWQTIPIAIIIFGNMGCKSVVIISMISSPAFGLDDLSNSKPCFLLPWYPTYQKIEKYLSSHLFKRMHHLSKCTNLGGWFAIFMFVCGHVNTIIFRENWRLEWKWERGSSSELDKHHEHLNNMDLEVEDVRKLGYRGLSSPQGRLWLNLIRRGWR